MLVPAESIKFFASFGKIGGFLEKPVRHHSKLLPAPRKTALQRIRLLTVSGKIDLIAIVSVDSAAELDQQLDRISEINGIRSTETSIVLGTKFDRS